MPKAGEIRYCPELGGRETNAAFVWIPPGSFWMDNNDYGAHGAHLVTISKGFWLQQWMLTVTQYSKEVRTLLWIPQLNISWTEVVDFCRGKPLRMPTEAEWEYAARANTGDKYKYAGSNVDNKIRPNTMNRFDIEFKGTLSEWCSDRTDEENLSSANSSVRMPQIDPQGILSGPARIHRTGRPPDFVYTRADDDPDDKVKYVGVRLIWEPKDA